MRSTYGGPLGARSVFVNDEPLLVSFLVGVKPPHPQPEGFAPGPPRWLRLVRLLSVISARGGSRSAEVVRRRKVWLNRRCRGIRHTLTPRWLRLVRPLFVIPAKAGISFVGGRSPPQGVAESAMSGNLPHLEGESS